MSYHQITSAERYMISDFRKQGCSKAQIARYLGRHRSTIGREFERNGCHVGAYRPSKACERARGRRKRSYRTTYFAREQLDLVESLLKEKWSPEQISGTLKKQRKLSISHETIYRHVWRDRWLDGSLWTHLRQSPKKLRKRYRAYDSRGRMAGKRHISERPISVDNKSRFGHWEIDTVIGTGSRHCIATIVERKSGYTLIGKLRARNTEQLNRRVIELIRRNAGDFLSITADNGTEFHQYKKIEKATGVPFYFATPYHSWERGLNENTNGLIRQYLPKGTSMTDLTQHRCNAIANALNTRPRKRLNYKTPKEVLNGRR